MPEVGGRVFLSAWAVLLVVLVVGSGLPWQHWVVAGIGMAAGLAGGVGGSLLGDITSIASWMPDLIRSPWMCRPSLDSH